MKIVVTLDYLLYFTKAPKKKVLRFVCGKESLFVKNIIMITMSYLNLGSFGRNFVDREAEVFVESVSDTCG